MRYTFQLIPQGVIPRDPKLTFQVQDLPAVAAESRSVCMLTAGQVGFGSAADELTGSAKLGWDDVTNQMTVGDATGGGIVKGANAAASSDANGGGMELKGGAGDTSGTGGDSSLSAGTGGADGGQGGTAWVQGGRGGSTSGNGGTTLIVGGEAPTNGNGGNVTIIGGTAAGGGTNGSIGLQVGAGANITMSGLPTSSAGLPGGALWNDAGTLKIA